MQQEETITHGQRKRFYSLCRSLSLEKDAQKGLVTQYSEGVTDSLKDGSGLTFDQMRHLLDDLQAQARNNRKAYDQKEDRLRKKLLSLGYEIGWSNPASPEQQNMHPSRVNYERVNTWCKGKKSKFEKPLNELTYHELVDTITQFKHVHRKFLQQADL